MSRGVKGRFGPRPPVVLNKRDILAELREIDDDREAIARVLKMETSFREWAQALSANMATLASPFQDFNTSPFVLMLYSFTQRLQRSLSTRWGYPSREGLLICGNQRWEDGRVGRPSDIRLEQRP